MLNVIKLRINFNYKDDRVYLMRSKELKRIRQNKERLLVFNKPIFLTRPFTSKDSQHKIKLAR